MVNNQFKFKDMKKNKDYCGVVDLVAKFHNCCTSEINMEEVVLAVLQDKSWDDVVSIPLTDRVF